MKNKKSAKLIAMLIAAMLLISSCVSVFAVDWAVSKSKTASNTSITEDAPETKITLSLPSAEHPMTSDVVFVMDASSCSQEVIAEITTMLADLKASVGVTNAKINVGVVFFRGNAETVYPLSEYTGDNTPITDALNAGIAKMDTSPDALRGSNVPAGVLAAKNMLEASETLPIRQYVMLMSDGATYVYTDGSDPASHLGRSAFNTSGNLYEWQVKYANGGRGFVPAGWSTTFPLPATFANSGDVNDWNTFLAGIEAVRGEFSKYDGEYTRTSAGQVPLTPPAPAYTVDTITDFIVNSEEAIWQTANFWGQLVGDGVKCYAINVGLPKNMGAFYSFMNYLGATGSGTAANFSAIKNDILYLMGSGTVTDVIGEKFDMVIPEGACPFTLALDGTAIPANVITAGVKWGFNMDEATGKYDYEVEYTPGDAEQFVWTINVPVESLKPIALSYTLKLIDTATAGSFAANKSAELVYLDSEGQNGGTELFEVPMIEFKKTAVLDENKPDDNPFTADTQPILLVIAAVTAVCVGTSMLAAAKKRGENN